MSKTGKIVSLEKNSKTLSPITDAQFVQYNNSRIITKIKQMVGLNAQYVDVSCVNVKEALDSLTKIALEEKTLDVEFTYTYTASKITISSDNVEYVRNSTADVDCATTTLGINCQGTYYAWSPGDVHDPYLCVYTATPTPRAGTDFIYRIMEISPGSGTYEMGEAGPYVESYQPEINSYTATKTYAQIMTALNDGKVVNCQCLGDYGDQIVFNNYSIGTDYVYFSGIDIQGGKVFGYKIKDDDTITKTAYSLSL